MKFGRRLKEDLILPDWSEFYLPYNSLKNMILAVSCSDDQQQSIGEPTAKVTKTHFHELYKRSITHTDKFFDQQFLKVENLLFGVQPSTGDEARSSLHERLKVMLYSRDNQLLEPPVREGSDESDALKTLAELQHITKSLRSFVVVNNLAKSKIEKKFSKHIGSEGNKVPNVRRTRGKSPSTRRRLNKDVTKTKREDTKSSSVFNNCILSCTKSLPKLQKFRDFLAEIEEEIMLNCSSLHEYLLSQQLLLDRKVAKVRTQAREANIYASRHPRLHRLSQIVDFDLILHPVSLLTVVILLPFLTLATTYYLSSRCIFPLNNETSALELKGYFISASMDYFPASSVGALGLGL
eukprot:g3178.t1